MQYLTPLILAVVAGGTAWFVGNNLPGAIGAFIGGLIAGWWIEKKKAGDAAGD